MHPRQVPHKLRARAAPPTLKQFVALGGVWYTLFLAGLAVILVGAFLLIVFLLFAKRGGVEYVGVIPGMVSFFVLGLLFRIGLFFYKKQEDRVGTQALERATRHWENSHRCRPCGNFYHQPEAGAAQSWAMQPP